MFSMGLSNTAGQKQSSDEHAGRDEHQPDPSATVQKHRSAHPVVLFQFSHRGDDVLNVRAGQAFDQRQLAKPPMTRVHALLFPCVEPETGNDICTDNFHSAARHDQRPEYRRQDVL